MAFIGNAILNLPIALARVSSTTWGCPCMRKCSEGVSFEMQAHPSLNRVFSYGWLSTRQCSVGHPPGLIPIPIRGSLTANYAVTQLTNAILDAREDRLIDLSEIIDNSTLLSTTKILQPSKINAMVIKAMARNIGPLANVVILLLGVIYTVKILVHGTFIPRLSHYPQPAELIAHLRRFATHALAVSITSYVNMCEYCLHILLVVSWFPLHQWSILKFLSFVAEKIFGPSLLPAPVADVMTGAKIEPYHANIFVNLLPVSVSSQLMLRSCYHQSLAPVRGSLWKMLPAIPYMLAQSPMPADVIDQVISLFSGVEHSLEAEACPMVTSRITATFACVVVTPLMVVYLRRAIWNVCHQALCLVARAAGMVLFWLLKIAATIVFKFLKFVLGCICTVSVYRSYSLADDLMSSPLVPVLMMRNTITVRRACIQSTTNSINTVSGAQQGAPESINEDKEDVFNEEMSRRMSASSNAKPSISTAAATEADPTPPATTATADPTPSATTKTAAEPTPSAATKTAAEPTPSAATKTAAEPTPSATTDTVADPTPSATTTTAANPAPSATTATAADPTADSVNTLGGAQQVAPENINEDTTDTTVDPTPSATTATTDHIPPTDITASGGEGLEASMWAPGNQAVEYDTQEEIDDLWSAFHSMKKQTKGELAATAKPMASISTAASGGEGLEASICVNTLGGAQQVAPENINEDTTDTRADPTPSATTATTDHIPPTDITASGGEGSEASMWAPGNQAVEFDTQEEIDDLWSAFHSMKKQTKGELAATAKPRSSIDTAASVLALVFENKLCLFSAWVQWGIRARDYCQFPTGWSCNQVGQFRHPPLANIGVEAYRADSRLDGAPAESIQTIPVSYLGAYQLVRVNPANGDPASM
ncbi:hypothetical protein BU17DRAFT_62661 [Hysterangium stoloniferum]|nr:hypothetical protein BU17DRAFT_62661 [Hysterangium stoloniferum]